MVAREGARQYIRSGLFHPTSPVATALTLLAAAVLIVGGFALPTLGRVLLRLVAGAVVIVACIAAWMYLSDEQDRRRRARQEAEEMSAGRALLAGGGLEVTGATLGPDAYASGRSYALEARIRNRDTRATVTGVRLAIQILDCARPVRIADIWREDSAAVPRCEQVGSASEWLEALVPPEQARDAKATVYLGHEVDFKGRFEWHYRITAVRARLPGDAQ